MNVFLAHALTVLILAAMTVAVIYVSVRLCRLFGTSRWWPLAIGIGTVLTGAIVTTALAPRSASGVLGTSYVAFGDLFYLFLNLVLALGIAHLAQHLFKAPERASGVVAVAVAAAMTVAGLIGGNRLATVETTIPIRGLQRELRVVQVSDVHLGHHRGADWAMKVVDRVSGARPDLVVITGDLVDSDAALDAKTLAPFGSLTAPTFYVLGNHEETVDLRREIQLVSAAGVRVLRNQVVEVKGVQIVGLDYMNADEKAFNMHPSTGRSTIRKTLSDLSLRQDLPTILLHHAPTGASYARARGVDLYLAGHTHGGQVFPSNLVTPLLFPYNQGLYSFGAMKVFVSPGAGTFMLRARLKTSNRIDVLHLVPF